MQQFPATTLATIVAVLALIVAASLMLPNDDGGRFGILVGIVAIVIPALLGLRHQEANGKALRKVQHDVLAVQTAAAAVKATTVETAAVVQGTTEQAVSDQIETRHAASEIVEKK